jgi:hypothetical protein
MTLLRLRQAEMAVVVSYNSARLATHHAVLGTRPAHWSCNAAVRRLSKQCVSRNYRALSAGSSWLNSRPVVSMN